ncbi:CaiB/BaiF CoA-transferase family protein [Nocardioides marmotae]|uniref:CaiB/BaiF CoA-transferase family protein n=1 Tax=Nocardioides marmotae TaxID=2663857 RepID=UPI0012B5DF9B|nr:CoA transferase [Nocardioides marmotae]MBC9732341.1 CoA transferase [Nocardioides marmotae]MTB83461.1 hypothetical protein [Nocardioides marmotae]
MTAPLDLRVLNLGRGVGAAFATRQLADLGARATWWRWSSPRPGDWPPDDVFLSYFTTGLEVHDERLDWPAVVTALEPLASEVDVVVVDLEAHESGEGDLLSRLQPLNPGLVLAVCSHFGRSGPYAGWVGDELTDYALGGYWGFGGDPAREPLRVTGQQAQFHAGLALSLAAVAAVRHARRTGRGQEVEVSAVEAMIGSHWDATIAWTHAGTTIERTGPDIFPTSDGHVFFYQVVFFPNLPVLIGRPELAIDARWSTWPAWLENAGEFWQVVAEWCRTRTTAEIVEAAQALRLPVVGMADAQSLLVEPSLVERGHFRDVAGVRLPGRPAVWTEPWKEPEAGAWLGERRGAAKGVAERLAAASSTTGSAGAGPPLEGVRVLELTNNWAGPLAGRHLGDLGAEVLKVEVATRPATRAGFHPAGRPGLRHWNRAGYFNEMNRNKRGFSLDLSTDRGRELFLELVRTSDVVLENNASRVMPKLGLGYEVLREVNPRLVMASISGFGATGTRKEWVAFGSNIEAATGLAAMTGYDGETPYRTGSFVADPIGGTQAALAIVAALERVARCGRGTHLDLSLIEATTPWTLLGLAALQSTGSRLVPLGSADAWDAPTGAYPTAGDDEWVAIAVRSADQWRSLVALADFDLPDWSAEERVLHRAEIDEALGGWTRTAPQYDVARSLQAVGVPAAPILKNPQFHTDPHLHARGTFVWVDHPETGVLPYPGFPWRFSVTHPEVRHAAPSFGEANAYVLRHLLGLGEDQIHQLYVDGVTADEPVGLEPI